LLAALVNLLQNAFKFTHAHTQVTLRAHADAEHVSIDVEDQCGGLAPGVAENMFRPFNQGGFDKSGLGLGLSIARRTAEAEGGSLTVRDLPGSGCVFTLRLPRHSV
jgi:signal transduction histidine kinase